MIAVHDLGTRDYAEVLEFQRTLVAERLQGGPDALILVEHPHVITRGTGTRTAVPSSEGIPVFDVERGGGATYHGPGQLVGYPILHLKERGLGLSEYLRGLEEALIEAVSPWVHAERIAGFTGIWSEGRKLASIGVAVRRWVTFHGFALNVSTDLSHFQSIHPCGLEPSQMTSLQSLLGSPVPMADVRRSLLEAFLSRFTGAKIPA